MLFELLSFIWKLFWSGRQLLQEIRSDTYWARICFSFDALEPLFEWKWGLYTSKYYCLCCICIPKENCGYYKILLEFYVAVFLSSFHVVLYLHCWSRQFMTQMYSFCPPGSCPVLFNYLPLRPPPHWYVSIAESLPWSSPTAFRMRNIYYSQSGACPETMYTQCTLSSLCKSMRVRVVLKWERRLCQTRIRRDSAAEAPNGPAWERFREGGGRPVRQIAT